MVFAATLAFVSPARGAASFGGEDSTVRCPAIAVEAGAAPTAMTLNDIDHALGAVRADHYPELAGFDVQTRTLKSDADFLRATVELGTAWKRARDRTYLVLVSPRLLASPPSPRALRAILTHELSHVRDYARMSPARLAWFAATYALGPIRDYERRTDETALEKGEGCGLVEYRLWLYARERGGALARKKSDYYTPVEILDWIRIRAGTKP
jgi:hypothetical protein